MRLFPGVKANMGRWTYYVVRMSMKDLANSVEFASDTYDSPALDEALQRALNVSRSKKEIVSYLQKQEDRFFNSIVIAAIGGSPAWYPIDIADTPALAIFADDPSIAGAFGVLRFSAGEHFYALDGQHRLKAIKDLVDPESDAHANAPKGFADEQISVVLVLPGDAESIPEFRQRFRRLFGHLNRYAKPMDPATNIIMDEDDTFAIITRRLFSEHDFFKTVGPHRESKVVFMDKGKNMRSGQIHLTTLETLYALNEILLSSNKRFNEGWDSHNTAYADFKRFRPEDDNLISSLYEELSSIWSALLEALPVLKSDPSIMRNHNVIDADDDGGESDNLLFWPIGQEVLAKVARRLIDDAEVDPNDLPAVVEALTPLAKINWYLGSTPWKYWFIVPGENNGWKMRSETRRPVINLAITLIIFLLQDKDQNPETVANLRQTWESQLIMPVDVTIEEVDQMWSDFIAIFK